VFENRMLRRIFVPKRDEVAMLLHGNSTNAYKTSDKITLMYYLNVYISTQ
jgi:hypothetical protein